MASFKNGEVEIAYLDEGEGEPIVLVHGFASTKEVNWVQPGWVDDADARRAARDRARQSRPWGSRANCTIPPPITAPPWRRTCARCSIISASSAPTSWAIRWARASPRFWPSIIRSACARLIIGGLGIRLVEGVGDCRRASPRRWRRRRSPTSAIRPAARSAASPSRPNPTSRRSPPASAVRARRLSASRWPAFAAPVLVAVGSKDDVAGSGPALAALIPGAAALDIPGRDHMLAVGDKVFKAGVLEFLNQRP